MVVWFATVEMARPGTRTVTVEVQAGSVPPTGQVLPGSLDAATAVRTLSPLSGLSTVTE